MTAPFRDPDDLAAAKDTSNYHDEEQEIQNDELPGHRTGRPAPRPKSEQRRPPPRRRHYDDN